MRRTLFAVILSALLAGPAAAGAETVVAPITPWQASTEGGLCRVERKFELGGQPHLLILEQTAPGSAFGMAVASPLLAELDPAQPILLGFLSGDPGLERRARVEPNRQFGKVAIVTNLSFFPPAGEPHARIETAVLAEMDRVTVTQGNTLVNFASGSLGEAAAALNGCTAQMLRSWGLDPEVQYGLQSAAFPEQEAKLARELRKAYPPRAYRALQNGPLEVAAIVDPSGVATGCKLIVSSSFPDLDAAACKAISKARYRPARDAEGDPVASYWKTRITYALSETDPVLSRP
ncbi:MAG: hypothetical protein ABS87_13180 [Sphingomonas sp. SCN 67-18]|nr:energy transducer TonB [Sphingomonas sp. SCN 67-18]ODU19784.1 MAG: hypothetical protein ABS87_13180 [Sphingomonas sp. SCN 67-18]